MSEGMRWNAKAVGIALCVVGAALIVDPGLLARALRAPGSWPTATLALALGLEALALAFWCWARASSDAAPQVRRWTWLRRPAQATWLAAAAGLLIPWTSPHAAAAVWLPHLAAGAVVWAGLELMAALPLARPYSDLSGPLLVMRPWLPALLPAAGFLLLWHTASLWTTSAAVCELTIALLLVTALLATLRAFGRRQWVMALRWLTVSESALAAALLATSSLASGVVLVLWLGACGGRAFMLAGELRGATPRRGRTLSRLWRSAGWLGSTALSWPLLAALAARLGSATAHAAGAASLAITLTLFELSAAGLAVVLTAYVSVRRMVRAMERRRVMRPDPALTLSHVCAMITLALGPAALATAFVSGARFDWAPALLALLPALIGGALAILGTRGPLPVVTGFESAGARARRAARIAFRAVIEVERRLTAALTQTMQAAIAPLRDLHTGDAQEYLLFVVGLSVLALVLPFLR